MSGYVDHRKYKTKGKVEIKQFYCEKYLPFIKECVTWSNGDARLGLLKLKYPFLTEEQRRFVKDFEEGNGYLPVFYIIFNYVRSSDINKVIDLWYGFSAPEPMFIKKIANVFGKNVETIRLRKKNGIVFDRAQPHKARYLNELLDGNCRAPYNNYLPQPYITKSSEVFRDIDNRERLHGKFYAFTVIFRMLFPEYGNFKFCKSDEQILIKKGLYPKNLQRVGQKIYYLTTRQFTKDVTVGYSEFFNGETPNKETRELIRHIAVSCFGLSANDKGVVFAQKRMDVGEELYKIIQENNRPMSHQEIYDRFIEKYPERRYMTVMQVRNHLVKNKNISSIGRSSTYALASWKIFTGTIRDKVMEVLGNSPVPLRLKTIVEEVRKVYPKTNAESLCNSILCDERHRFVSLKRGYWGLAANLERDKAYYANKQ